MIYEWVTVGDKSVCDDCVVRDGKRLEMEEWENQGLPREGATVCGDACRCSLIPVSMLESQADVPSEWEGLTVDEVRDQVFEDIVGRIKFDKRSGKALLIDQFRSVTGLSSMTYQAAAKFSAKFDKALELIYAYEQKIGPLPEKYYDIPDINKKLQWLQEQLKNERDNQG